MVTQVAYSQETDCGRIAHCEAMFEIIISRIIDSGQVALRQYDRPLITDCLCHRQAFYYQRTRTLKITFFTGNMCRHMHNTQPGEQRLLIGRHCQQVA